MTSTALRAPLAALAFLTRIPIGRVGTTSEVAAAVIFLASESAGLVNGTSLVVDGGWTAQ